MVQSIWLRFKEKQDKLKLFHIVNEKYPLDLYNKDVYDSEGNLIDERCSIEKGYCLKDNSILIEFLKSHYESYDLDLGCKCDFCSKIKTHGNLILFMFGTRIEDDRIGRNIWLANWMCFIQDYRLRLLYFFLTKIKELLESKGIECYFDLNDVDKEIIEDLI